MIGNVANTKAIIEIVKVKERQKKEFD